ncbi:hypothetical protein PR202_ga22507 [Eleusine coracana subsp. coracana]|uniref:Uncharacterized protein n=1 Tax=Eleusine coracana subsp. coracana TaxID=191504 RepID=A0AAV5D3H5_ELECO|nr:hypothetical protein PR202_ga22507 [Eleusine coracana subsp. coracana]
MGSSPSVLGSDTSSVPSKSAINVDLVTGSHVFTIHGYSHLAGLARNEFYSLGTFAAAGRHRWSILFYPNGIENYSSDLDPMVAIYLRLDQTYAARVKARFRVSLLDLAGQPYSSTIKASRWTHSFTCGAQNGLPRFAKKATLEQCASYGNDSIRIRCDITVLNLKETNNEDGSASKFIVVPPPDMQQHLGHLLLTGEGADLKLEVDGETFFAHKSILAARSPVFRAELFGHMKENTQVSIGIEGIQAKVFKAFLHFIYNDALPEMEDGSEAMSQHLLVAADRYDLERLKLICQDQLCKYIDASLVGEILSLADLHSCDGLKKACFEFLKSRSNLKAVAKTDGFDHLATSSPSVLKELLLKVAL